MNKEEKNMERYTLREGGRVLCPTERLEAALERLETVMTEACEVEKDQWVDFDKLVDNSFAQKAMEAQ